MDFSARFKQLRKESGLTQQDIANVVFVDKTTVSKWELGANYPNQNVQTALADFFKVSVDYLLGRTDIRNANSIANFQKSTIYRAFAAFPCKIIVPICTVLQNFVPYFVP